MPRIRTLKPEHRQHRKIGPLSDRTYRLWVSMILEAEDAGRLICSSPQLRAVTWPYQPKVSLAMVETSIQELATLGLIRLYDVGGIRYADFPSWADHQRIDHPAKAKLPPYQEDTESSRVLARNSRTFENDPGGSGSGREVEGKWKGREREPSAAQPAASSALLDGFQIPASVAAALKRAPRLGGCARLMTPAFWLAEVRANQGVDFSAEILKAEAWMVANPKRAARRDLSRFLHTWLGHAEREETVE